MSYRSNDNAKQILKIFPSQFRYDKPQPNLYSVIKSTSKALKGDTQSTLAAVIMSRDKNYGVKSRKNEICF